VSPATQPSSRAHALAQAASDDGPDASRLLREGRRINFAWLLRLRWGTVAGQVITILGVQFGVGVELPLVPLFAVIAIELLTNAACALWLRGASDVREWMLAGLLALDVLLMTVLLYFTGGPSNPFSFLYLVHIALAAVVLRDRWTWALVALSIVCLGSLFVEQAWIARAWYDHPEQHVAHMRLHLEGMYVAFGIAAAFIVYFVTRVTRDLARREAELARARTHAQRSERLASLATMAAGAAHELSTPLSTIAVVAKELQRELESTAPAGTGAAADAELIRREVERCRAILEQMAIDAGQSWGEGFAQRSVRELVDCTLAGLPESERARVELAGEGMQQALYLPVSAVSRALRGVIRNALQASEASATVEVRVSCDARRCELVVRDRGLGMEPAVLARAGEPFFTTKEPGHGMGLGLFLTRAVFERLGGALAIDSRAGAGTQVVLTLPATRSAPPGAGAFAAEAAP
jgi:two-component system, sensor histidine kinase RegB